MSPKNAVFGTFDFAANGLSIAVMDQGRSKNGRQYEKRANAPGAVRVSSELDPKTVTLEGIIRADTRDDLDTLMDNVQYYLSLEDQTLDLDHAGGTRRYIADGNVIITQEAGDVTRAAYSFEATVPTGYGVSTATETLASGTITTGSEAIAITVGGTYDAAPIVTLVINTITLGAGTSLITLGNSATTENATMTYDFAAGDTLTFNFATKKAYRNNSEIYLSGSWMTWKPGAGTIAYTDSFSARDVDYTVTYTRRWR